MPMKLIVVAMVVMLILSGCSISSVSTPNPSTETSSNLSTPTDTPTRSEGSTPENSSQEDVEQSIRDAHVAADSKSITPETRRVMVDLSRDFYRELPTTATERRTETVRAAHALCAESRPIEQSVFEASDEFDRQSYRLYHATNTVNENFNKEVSTRKLRSAMSSAGSISKYTPLVGSYNRMYEAACAVDPEDDASIERFYIASASFGVEAVLVQQQIFFKSSFAATRYTTNKLSLMKIRTVTGDKGYGMLLSEIHWAYRGSQASAAGYIFEKSTEFSIDVTESDQDALQNAAHEQYEKYRADANYSIDDGRKAVENTTRVMEECAEASKIDESDSLWDQASGTIDEWTGAEWDASFESISGVTPGDIPAHVNKSIDDPHEFASCLDEQS